MAAFGLGAGIGGTVAVMSLSPTTTASVDSKSDVTANGSLNVNANDVLQLPNDVIGTAAVGGIGGEGFTVEVITVHDTVDAHIADSTASGAQGVSVEANGQRTFDATVVAFGAGLGRRYRWRRLGAHARGRPRQHFVRPGDSDAE